MTMSNDTEVASHVVVQCPLAHLADVLGPFERKGFCLVGLRPDARTGRAVLALRSTAGHAELAAALVPLCAAARSSLRAPTELVVSASREEALAQMAAHFGQRELVQWGVAVPDAPGEFDDAPLGHHCNNSEALWLNDVLRAPARGADGGLFTVIFATALLRGSADSGLPPRVLAALLPEALL